MVELGCVCLCHRPLMCGNPDEFFQPGQEIIWCNCCENKYKKMTPEQWENRWEMTRFKEPHADDVLLAKTDTKANRREVHSVCYAVESGVE